jgi:hypothetical protein
MRAHVKNGVFLGWEEFWVCAKQIFLAIKQLRPAAQELYLVIDLG